MNSVTPKTKLTSKPCVAKLLLLSLLLAALVLIANKSYLRLLIRGHLDYARAHGYPTTMAELYAFYEYPPPGENAADLYLEAFEYFVEWDEEDERLLPIFGDVQITPGQYMDEPTLQLVSQYLDDNHDALILLHRAAIFPQCRYPIESDDKIYSIDHYRGIRQSNNLLALESLYYANTQRFDLTAQTLIDSFTLSNSLKNEPLLISWLVRTACVEHNISILNEVLDLTALPERYISELKYGLLSIDYDYEHSRALIGEYAVNFNFKSNMYEWENERKSISSLVLLWFNISGHYEKSQCMYYENLLDCIGVLKHTLPKRIQIVNEKGYDINNFFKSSTVLDIMISCLWYPIYFNSRYETSRRLAIIALAIEQYRHDCNKLPDSLNELVPGYLKTVIEDPYDGNDLRYKKLEKGYVVYSVGEDRTDNDGTRENEDGYTYMPGTDITFTVRR